MIINTCCLRKDKSMLPPLHALSINPQKQDTPHVDASWQWDASTYQVRFSVDTAIEEQISGLGEMDGGQFKPAARPLPRHQLVPLNVLRAVREYTIQRLWDLECRVPWFDPNDRSRRKPDQPPDDNNEPFPDTGSGMVREVAKWVLAVMDTQTADVARKTAGERARGQQADDEEDGEVDYNRRLRNKETEIKARIKTEQDTVRRDRNVLRATLLEIEEMYAKALDVLQVGGESKERLPDDMELEVARFLVSEQLGLTVPSMADCRLNAEPGYYQPRYVKAEKYLRWVKIQTSLSDGTQPLVDGSGCLPPDTLYGVPVAHEAGVPSSLDGSFYTGFIDYDIGSAEDRLDDLQMDHVVPRNHMKNCMLVKELGLPDNMAMNTVITTKYENSQKGDKMLPLGDTQKNHRDMRSNTAVAVNAFGDKFGRERRMAAARVVCATYLQLFMLERKPDGNTELGPRRGGLYYSYREDIFSLMRRVPGPGVIEDKLYVSRRALNNTEASRRLEFRQAWTWEAGIPLLQWFYLNQPYNPIPDAMYRASTQRRQDFTLLFDFFYKDLLTRRFGGFDTLSDMFRREMQEEVPDAPLPLSDETENPLANNQRREALDELRKNVRLQQPRAAASSSRKSGRR